MLKLAQLPLRSLLYLLCRSTPFAPFSAFLRVLRGKTCNDSFMSTRESIGKESPEHTRDEPFNGAELSESVLAREWNSPEEDAAWSNL
jgi:hypothetical protein